MNIKQAEIKTKDRTFGEHTVKNHKPKEKIPEWFRLDNAATIFPGQNSNTWSNIFRFSVELKENIDYDRLCEALKRVMPRFPGFDVRIKRGLFWYYFEKNPNAFPDVNPDINNPCHRVKFRENKGYLFRVYYHGTRISVDTFHAIADGHGASVFTCTLAAEYLRLGGADIPASDFVFDTGEPPHKPEIEDSFKKYADSAGKLKRGGKFVYHAGGTKLAKHNVNIISGIMDFEALHKITKSLGVTVTEYLAAQLLDIFIEKQRREKHRQKEVCIQVPIDLRRTFESCTMRNFTICLRIVIDPNLGDYSFEELLREVSLQMKLAGDPKRLNAMMTANRAIEKNPFLKYLPLSVKNLGVGISFALTGEQTTTALLSNLGRVELPDAMAEYVEKLMIMPGPGKRNGARCAVVTFNGKMVVTFADLFEETDIEREFFTRLVKAGVKIKIESNRS